MKTNILKVGFVGVLLLLTVNAYAADWLFKGGKSDYQIVVPVVDFVRDLREAPM